MGYLSQIELNDKYPLEYSRLKEFSEKIIQDNFLKSGTKLKQIEKSINGYSIYRFDTKNKWIIKININDRQIEVKRSI